jgi:hypothetical protein
MIVLECRPQDDGDDGDGKHLMEMMDMMDVTEDQSLDFKYQ